MGLVGVPVFPWRQSLRAQRVRRRERWQAVLRVPPRRRCSGLLRLLGGELAVGCGAVLTLEG